MRTLVATTCVHRRLTMPIPSAFRPSITSKMSVSDFESCSPPQGQSLLPSDNSRFLSVHISKNSHTGNGSKNDLVDSVDATELVDNLLQRTETLMTGNYHQTIDMKPRRPHDLKDDIDHSSSFLDPPAIHHIIAFSGGIDSSVVAALVHNVRGRCTATGNDKVTAVLGLSPAVPGDQRMLAENIAQHIGIELETVATTEGDDEVYLQNDGRACLACKTHLYTCLNSIAQYYDCRSSNRDHDCRSYRPQLYNGTNADDLQDPTRLGLIAAQTFHVQSPLEDTPKALVRLAGKHLGLPNWNYAASPCLRSRLAMGVPAIPDHLRRIEHAEGFVKRNLGLPPSQNMRVRLLSNNRAMIEVESDYLDQLQDQLQDDPAWNSFFVEELGFRSVEVRPFKTGSVAVDSKMIPSLTQLQRSS